MSYLFEMHLHTDEVSRCASIPAKQIAELYLTTDYKGIVVTDHMNASAFNNAKYKNATWDEKVTHFLEGYNILKEELNGKMVVLLGMEINFYESDNDYLVYGITEDFLRSNGDLMDYSPEDFSLLAKENGLLFYRKIAENFKKYNNFTLMFEIGYSQAEDVSAILSENGYLNIEVKKDFSGNNRVIVSNK